jgi:hypothetical protein
MQFFQPHVVFFLLGPDIPFSALFSETTTLCYSLKYAQHFMLLPPHNIPPFCVQSIIRTEFVFKMYHNKKYANTHTHTHTRTRTRTRTHTHTQTSRSCHVMLRNFIYKIIKVVSTILKHDTARSSISLSPHTKTLGFLASYTRTFYL